MSTHTFILTDDRADQLAQALDRVRFRSAKQVLTFYGDTVFWFMETGGGAESGPERLALKIRDEEEKDVIGEAGEGEQPSLQSEPEIVEPPPL